MRPRRKMTTGKPLILIAGLLFLLLFGNMAFSQEEDEQESASQDYNRAVELHLAGNPAEAI
ncbi:MAG TPA: hypothetical protein PLQ76_06820, partial [bacterium]|nr:hypothetical protein [bacterium]